MQISGIRFWLLFPVSTLMLRLQQTHSRKRLERKVDLPEAVENRSDGEMQKPRECDWVNRRSTWYYCGVIAVNATNLENEN